MRLAVSLLLCACLCLAQMPMTQPFGLPLQPRLSWLGNRAAIPGYGLVGAWDLTTDNLLKYSELVNYWTVQGAVIHLSAETAPDGTSNVSRVDSAEDTSLHLHRVYRTITTPVGPGTFSCFVKSAGIPWVYLRVYSAPHVTWHFAYFDIQNGVVGTKQDGILAAGIEPVGNGWWRVWASTTSDGSTRAYSVAISLEDNQPIYTHSQEHEGKGIYVWGAQVNEGSTPKPYVRTTDGQSVPNFAPGQTAALQLGSTASADTNDPALSQQGMVHTTDDYLLSLVLPEAGTLATNKSALVVVNTTSTSGTLFSIADPTREIAQGHGLDIRMAGAGLALVRYLNLPSSGNVSPSISVPIGSYVALLLRKSGATTRLTRMDTGQSASVTSVMGQADARIGVGTMAVATPDSMMSALTSSLVLYWNRAITDAEASAAYRWLRDFWAPKKGIALP